jgi:glycosyltransferase involved in cell wall biosynthesis
VPLVHTAHGPMEPADRDLYAAHARKAVVVCISRSQRSCAPPVIGDAPVIHNPLRVEEWPFRERKDDFALWLGRLCPDKGPHRAVAAARAAGVPLVLAGVVQPWFEHYYARCVEPLIDGDAVRFVGEVAGERKQQLIARARAMLMPIRWNEPFGLVMAEAGACGTPVIAFREGAADEIVRDGVSGFLVDDETAMAAALRRVHEIDPAACRLEITRRCGVETVVDAYVRVYEAAAEPSRAARSIRGPGYSGRFSAALPARQRLHTDG